MTRISRRHVVVLTYIVVILLFGCSSIAISQDNNSTILLRGATIIDGVSDGYLTGHSLLIQGNLIRDIPPSDAPVPSSAEVVDLDGKFIIPGLIDAHVHWLGWMGELFLNHGVTSVISMGDMDREIREKSRAVGSRLPRIFHTAGSLRLSNDNSTETIRDIVRDYLAKEPDMARFDTYDNNSSRAYALAAEQIHQAGYLIFGHTENALQSTRDGHDVVEHVWGFTQATMSDDELQAFQQGDFLTWAMFMTDWDRLDRMIEEAVAEGVYLNPTLVYEWGGMSKRADQRELEEYRALSNPELVYYPENIAGSLLAKHRQIKNFSTRFGNTPYVVLLPAADREVFEQGYRNVLEFIRRFVEAGGKLEAGTDTVTGGMPGMVLHQEMQMLVEAGLTPMQALKSATRWSAELLEGKNGALGPASIGSLEAGKRADLVVLSADPLRDINNTQKIESVMKDGRWIELGYRPEYYSSTSPSRSIAGASFAPVISSIAPAVLNAGKSGDTHIVLEGSGFLMTSLVKVDGISVKTDFINPRQIEFDLSAKLVASPLPDPYAAPGPAQNVGVVGYRSIEISAYNPPPEGGLSNSVHLLVKPN